MKGHDWKSRKRLGWVAAALVILAVVVGTSRMQGTARTITSPPESEVELTLDHEGTAYKLYRGDLYTTGPEPGRLTFVEHLYDPDFLARNYAVVDGIPNKRDPDTGTLHPTRRAFEEGFEG